MSVLVAQKVIKATDSCEGWFIYSARLCGEMSMAVGPGRIARRFTGKARSEGREQQNGDAYTGYRSKEHFGFIQIQS